MIKFSFEGFDKILARNLLTRGLLLLLFFWHPGKASIVEEQASLRFTKVPVEIYEGILARSSFADRIALLRTCKQFHTLTKPFVSFPQATLDLSRHFVPQTTLDVVRSKNALWVLAKEYEKPDALSESLLSLLRISATHEVTEQRIQLSLKIGFYTPLPFLGGTPHPVYCVPCPHGGVFVYAPHEQGTSLTFVNDAGVIQTHCVFEGIKKLEACHLSCNARYLALNIPSDNQQPIVFIPYQIDEKGCVYYTKQTPHDPWPQFPKETLSWHCSNLYPWNDEEFMFEVTGGIDIEGLPIIQEILYLKPDNTNSIRVESLEEQELPGPSEPAENLFPKPYTYIQNYNAPEASPFFLMLGYLTPPGEQTEDFWGMAYADDQELTSQEPSPYPYGLVLVKKIKNGELLGKIFLYETRKLEDIEENLMAIVGSHLLIATSFRHTSTPKITAIHLLPLKRLVDLEEKWCE